ncbi:hypothetical protein CONPUDRAFT_157904 [Coniophora puteana RWD-64-598 SS2]|uniref:Uncharacterized protein n=1 Tax=Coniophora puteana (strain RWD-64-598) TaxID=741705 RepID=A0A5M3MD11_CONPW|nr:uncharacterized protein CONPUDRAFT_157904 [Coniophora puteana RWD-64-598 SS2]EIW76730.1 hypothetical protein CONPUDRAFT_157904 [Coniophora puteana RWD-64-598 SS2]
MPLEELRRGQTGYKTRLRSKNADDTTRKKSKVDEERTLAEEGGEEVDPSHESDEEPPLPLDAIEYSDDEYLRAPTSELNVEVLTPEARAFVFEEPDQQSDNEDNQWQRNIDVDELEPEEDEDEPVEEERTQTPIEPLGDDDDVGNYEPPLEPPVDRAPTPPPPPPLDDQPAHAMSWWTEQEVDDLHTRTTILEAKEALAYSVVQGRAWPEKALALAWLLRARDLQNPRPGPDIGPGLGLGLAWA